jgi:uncharacterized caspase-like protein
VSAYLRRGHSMRGSLTWWVVVLYGTLGILSRGASGTALLSEPNSLQRRVEPPRRVALVIGNAAYATAPLKNPSHDAADMAAVLSRLGFAVRLLHNATNQTMAAEIEQFTRQLRRSRAGLLYYSGYGMQLDGQNYLIPVDAAFQHASDVKYQAIHLGWVLDRMEEAGNEINIVILDACRDTPFVRGGRSSQRGLAMTQAARGTLIAYATSPGKIALDQPGRNGLYTKYLLQYMTYPKLAVEQMFKKVRIAVQIETHGRQLPWESTSLLGDFYFAGR